MLNSGVWIESYLQDNMDLFSQLIKLDSEQKSQTLKRLEDFIVRSQIILLLILGNPNNLEILKLDLIR